MIENLDTLIDINLRLICESKDRQYFHPYFKDINRKDLYNSLRLAKIMEQKALITIINDRCDLCEFGLTVHNFGGWLEYLRVQKETEIQNELLENARQDRKDKADIFDLGNKKWQFNTKEISLIISCTSLIATIVSVSIAYISLKKKLEKQDLLPMQTKIQLLEERLIRIDSLYQADTFSRKHKK